MEEDETELVKLREQKVQMAETELGRQHGANANAVAGGIKNGHIGSPFIGKLEEALSKAKDKSANCPESKDDSQTWIGCWCLSLGGMEC